MSPLQLSYGLIHTIWYLSVLLWSLFLAKVKPDSLEDRCLPLVCARCAGSLVLYFLLHLTTMEKWQHFLSAGAPATVIFAVRPANFFLTPLKTYTFWQRDVVQACHPMQILLLISRAWLTGAAHCPRVLTQQSNVFLRFIIKNRRQTNATGLQIKLLAWPTKTFLEASSLPKATFIHLCMFQPSTHYRYSLFH